MPVAPSSNHAGRALAVAGLAVAVVLAGLWAAAVLYSRQDASKVKLGDQTFQAGSAKSRAAEVRRRGPFIVPDASPSHDRDIIVQHLGSDPTRGWHAFAAQPDGKPRSCTWEWRPTEHQFRARCDHSLTLPANGGQSRHYSVRVDPDGRLTVDVNGSDGTSTTAPAVTTTTVVITGR